MNDVNPGAGGMTPGERAFTAWAGSSKADATPLMWTWDEMPESQRERWENIARASSPVAPAGSDGEALRNALVRARYHVERSPCSDRDEVLSAIDEALAARAQPPAGEAVPVAWQWRYGDCEWMTKDSRPDWFDDEVNNPRFYSRPLFAHPAEPAERERVADRVLRVFMRPENMEEADVRSFKDAILDALRPAEGLGRPGPSDAVRAAVDAASARLAEQAVAGETPCICVTRGDGPEGCGLCNETGSAASEQAVAGEWQACLADCREFIDRFSDMRDGDGGAPEPNQAMQLVHYIDQVITAADESSVGTKRSEVDKNPQGKGAEG